MTIELVSVHVPKTGGSSLRAVLRQKYGRRLRNIYQHPPPGIAETAFKLMFARAIHGHFPASRFDHLNAPMIAFVRDPAEMQVSVWRYIRREAPRLGVLGASWQAALDLSVEDFMSYPYSVIARYLDVPMDRFAFIGDFATYGRDMAALADRFSLPWREQHENANPIEARVRITPQMRRDYERANPAEVEIYERVMDFRSRLN